MLKMAGFFDGVGAGEVRERFAAQVEQAHRRAEAAVAARIEIQGVRERVVSPRGELSVVVDASGRLLDVGLTDAALRLTPGALSRLILEMAQKAQWAAGERAVQVAAEAFGEEDAAVAHLRGEIAQLAPEPGGVEYS
ncbi:hypothetical protein CW368_12190 [Actinomycetales bacterium SN12]|nr:hypothetical protein CW368_12190 [Actinomycetales bacterium SN12]